MNNAIVDMTLTWPSGTIPYVLSASFGIFYYIFYTINPYNSFTDVFITSIGRYERSVIAKAILEFHNKTCIRFVPHTNQDDYLNIQPGNGYNKFKLKFCFELNIFARMRVVE
jgi:hypothetical protein